jgi:hypothetical protein
VTEILNAKYKKPDVAEVMKGLTHLDAHQKHSCFLFMFDKTLDVYPHEKTFKGRQQNTLDQHLTSAEESQKT